MCVADTAPTQVVFATSGNRKLVKPIKEAELVPLGSCDHVERTESEEVTVVLRPSTPPNLVLVETAEEKKSIT